ncbi:MAG TPA: hypothetical protein VGN76_16040 [Gemmatimonadales bacterium]|jgi:hypothetical protein|nr:hypothetical protein [Gemmatimonadales bacterium]
MSHHKFLTASAIACSVALIGCSDTTAPKQLLPGNLSSEHSRRSGPLHVEKECSTYHGRAGDFCTIMFSSLKEIKVGSRVIYARAVIGNLLDTDVRLVPPGRDKNIALGHCTVDLSKIDGTTGCVFSGGTGKFKSFHASVRLTVLPNGLLAWNGTYSFSPRSEDGDADGEDQ